MRRTCLLLAGLALAGAASAKDTAIVVGVATYSGLGAQWKLRGTLSDAKAMTTSLKRFGFDIVPLMDEAATDEAIQAALKRAATAVKPGERFVFYFAGHGCNKPFAGIGAADASPGGNHWIDATVLNTLVKAVPAASRTVILDACFSGGMIKDVGGEVSARFYQPPAAAGTTKSAGYADDDAPAEKFPPKKQASDEVCYVAAAGPGQIAQEAVAPPGNPQKERRGVFSYFLTDLLDKTPEKLSWGEAVESVRENMIKNEVPLRLLQPQTPVVSNPFAAQPVFAAPAIGTGTAPKLPEKPTVPKSLLKLLSAERPNAGMLTLTATDDRAAMVGEPRTLEAKVGEAGYLAIFQQEGAKFRRINDPGAESADEWRATPDRPRRYRVVSDAPGGIVLKAILFTDREAAEQALKLLPTGQAVGGDSETLSKDAFVGVASDYATAYANLRVADDLLGDLEIVDPAKAWTALRADDPVGKTLRAAVESFSPDLMKGIADAPAKDGPRLKTLLNVALSDRYLAANLLAAGAKAPADVAAKKDREGAVPRNAALLKTLMPGALK